MNSQYYHQTPIMKRILEYLGDAVYVKGSDPNPDSTKRYRRFDDIIHAMGDGMDIHRSNIDFRSLVLVIDLEYGNKKYPGEVFHNPLKTFNKIEPLRDNIRDMLDKNKIEFVETMTGQGYNFALAINRESPTYQSLLKIGKATRVLPWTAARELLNKQDKYDNLPLLCDHVASTAFGRLNDYIFDILKEKNNLELPVTTTDLFDNDEIAIFDTTQHGYLLNRRAFRIAYSLHQKFMMSDKYGYHGPPIVTLPSTGIPLEERVKIRQDERNNYRRAVDLARETKVEMPDGDLGGLITSYLLSETYQKHMVHAENLGFSEIDSKDKEYTFKRTKEEIPDIKPEDIFWDIPNQPDWNYLGSKNLNHEVWDMLNRPNDRLLNPGALRFIIKEMKDKNIPDKEIISTISTKYRENHFWPDDLWKNDPILRAEYWLRTLSTQ